MPKFELKLPQMGESVAEATITTWLKEIGDTIDLDDSIVEIATDKVDSDVPSDVEGTLVEKLFKEGDVVKVGQVLAIIETDSEINGSDLTQEASKEEILPEAQELEQEVNQVIEQVTAGSAEVEKINAASGSKFYSPLVRKIAETEGVSQLELDGLIGTGLEGRVTKDDILLFITNRKDGKLQQSLKQQTEGKATLNIEQGDKVLKIKEQTPVKLEVNAEDELIHLSRMGKLISDHMLHSKQKSAHVQSFIEVDVTDIVTWRAKTKDAFFEKHGEKLTYTPIFMKAIAQAIKKYPLVNISFDGVDQVVLKKAINLGMASALPDGNLIVPVIKNAEILNLLGMTKAVNDLATRSKQNSLKPVDVKGGTFTVTNIGSFETVFGTPIINQPECAILALGAIRKVPAVVETPEGDFIGIRQKMYISHSYDHRVINGALGGMFIKEVKDVLEAWDVNTDF